MVAWGKRNEMKRRPRKNTSNSSRPGGALAPITILIDNLLISRAPPEREIVVIRSWGIAFQAQPQAIIRRASSAQHC